MTLNTLIIGAGAIGSLIGAKLALSNHLVTLAARPSFVEAVRLSLIHISEPTRPY